MTIELGAGDAGTRRAVHVGDVVSVRLPESPTTGYRWQPDVDDSRLRTVDDRFEAASSARGGGGQRVLVLEALRPGAATVHLANRRSWESGPADEEFSVELDIQ